LSLAWSEELARYLFLWLAALSAAYAFKTGSHFALRFLVDRMGKRVKALMQSLVVLLVSLFLVIFVWKALEYTISMSNQVAPSTQISMVWPYSSAVAGGVLMLYYVLRNWWTDMKGNKEEIGGSEVT
ncbi:MAG: TRAP transporter small permease subunit, partial [Candidatus Aminicenantes bacterium]|nr:TRAP transporter small permease subunit [Candidatus Aminicenantes bacterium]